MGAIGWIVAGTFAVGDEGASGWAAVIGREGAAIARHAEFAAFALEEGEALHPEASADARVRFEGEIRVARGGKYRFGLEVEGGRAQLATIAPRGGERSGAPLVSAPRAEASAASGPASRCWSGDVELEPGSLRVAIEFERDGIARARLKTLWEMRSGDGSAGFAAEPIPTSVVRVPAARSLEVQRDLQSRRGRALLGELGCASCHLPPAAPDCGVERPGGTIPLGGSLERAAARAGEGWLRRWILDPQELKPGCGMPDVFGDAPDELDDATALLSLLESRVRDDQGVFQPGSQGAPPSTPPPAPDAAAIDPAADLALVGRGSELFHEIGCIACHGAFEPPAAAFRDDQLGKTLPVAEAIAPFGDLRSKWRASELAAFLRDPRATRTHGRMPSLGLDEGESAAIAAFLIHRFEAAPPIAPVAAIDAAAVARGLEVFARRGCASCHSLGDGTAAPSPAWTAPPITTLDPGRGCLAASEAARGVAPRYALAESVRADLRAGVESVKRASGAAAPLDAAARALAAFRCTACHERSRSGGLPEGLLAYCRTRVEADLGDEGRVPPRLDGAGSRLQSPWLHSVIADGARARPYLALRMPRFGADAAAVLTAGLAAIEGEWRSDDPRAPAAAGSALVSGGGASPEELALAGRTLAGSGGLNCITCHSFGDRPSAGTPGLDFRQLATRLRKEAWPAYALSPLRFKPGTRMPTYFEAGKSAAVAILDGDAALQIEALWTWFERAADMPAPDGVPSGRRMVLDVGDRPKVFRTFLERAGSRGIAVGHPSGLHFAFDAEQIRLTEAWRGEFLDVAPVWTGRGGNVAPQLGPIVWSAAPGPALLLAPPAGEWPRDSGRNHGLKFRGYELDPDGTPRFLWELREPGVPAEEPPRPDAVQVEERFVPDTSPDVLFVRTLTLTGLTRARTVLLRIDERSRVRRVENGELETPKDGVPSGVDFLSVVDPGRPCLVVIEVRP